MCTVLLVLIVTILFLIDKKLSIGRASPFVLFSIPITVIILLFEIVYPIIKYKPLTDETILIIIYGILLFSVGGLSYTFLFKHNYRKTLVLNQCSLNTISKFLLFFAIICILGMMLNLRSILNGRSLLMLEDQEFANHGLSAHMGNWVSICIIFFIGALKLKNIQISRPIVIGLLIICLALKFLTAIKGQLMIPIIGGIILLYLYKEFALNIKNILIIASLVFLLFTGVASLFSSSLIGDNQVYYFAFYLFSGITGLSGLTLLPSNEWGLYPYWIARFFINFYESFIGEGNLNFDSATRWIHCTLVNLGGPQRTNVGTLIGEIFINCGFFIGSIILFFLGWYSYYLYSKVSKGLAYSILYSYVGGCLFFNFFSSYIIQPGFYECQFVCVIVIFLSKIKLNHGKY